MIKRTFLFIDFYFIYRVENKNLNKSQNWGFKLKEKKLIQVSKDAVSELFSIEKLFNQKKVISILELTAK